jgi:hypothetical protein
VQTLLTDLCIKYRINGAISSKYVVPALPKGRNVPMLYSKMTERHQMRTPTKNQMALFFGTKWYTTNKLRLNQMNFSRLTN